MRYSWSSIGLFIVVAVGIPLWISSPRLESTVERRHATFQDREVDFLIVELSHDWRWELANDTTNPKTTEGWRMERGADLVFNAAYFNEDYTPSGFFKTERDISQVPWPSSAKQKDQHAYTFMVSILPNDFHLRYLPAHTQSEPTTDAFLSFPTLLADRHPLVEEDSQLYAERTILAEDADGRDYLIQTEKGSISLYEAAQWLAKQPEHFVIAGNLDGGPSTGLSMENGTNDIILPSAPVPSVILGYRE